MGNKGEEIFYMLGRPLLTLKSSYKMTGEIYKILRMNIMTKEFFTQSSYLYMRTAENLFRCASIFSVFHIYIHSLKKGGESLTNFSKQLIKNKMT